MEPQKQLVFTWGRSADCLHSFATGLFLTSGSVPLFTVQRLCVTIPQDIMLAHYLNDMITVMCRQRGAGTLDAVMRHVHVRMLEINSMNTQIPGTSVQFWRDSCFETTGGNTYFILVCCSYSLPE